MRRVKTTIVAGCLLAATAAVAIGAGAQGMPWHGGPVMTGPGPAGRGYLGFLAGVQLSDAQSQQVHELVRSAWAEHRMQIAQFRALRMQIADRLAGAGAVTADSVDALQQQAAQIGEQLDADRLAVAIQVRGLLTPEQLTRAASVHAQLKALREQERALLEQGRPPAP